MERNKTSHCGIHHNWSPNTLSTSPVTFHTCVYMMTFHACVYIMTFPTCVYMMTFPTCVTQTPTTKMLMTGVPIHYLHLPSTCDYTHCSMQTLSLVHRHSVFVPVEGEGCVVRCLSSHTHQLVPVCSYTSSSYTQGRSGGRLMWTLFQVPVRLWWRL